MVVLNLDKIQLALAGIKPRATEKLFDGSTVADGIHLRWNFDPQMGFPDDGFIVRRYKIINKKILSSLPNPASTSHSDKRAQVISHLLSHFSRNDEQIALDKEWHLKLPFSKNEAFQKLEQSFNREQADQRFSGSANELVNVIKQLTNLQNTDHQYNVYLENQEEDNSKNQFRAIDILMLASLDPYIARMLGLYIIDDEITISSQPNYTYLYVITGDWGNTYYPKINLKMPKQSFGATYLPITVDTIEFIPGAGVYLTFLYGGDRELNDIGDEYIAIGGRTSSKTITLKFESSIEELWITSRSSSDFNNIRVFNSGEELITSIGERTLYISSSIEPLKIVEIQQLPQQTIYIDQIQTRKRKGQIGNQFNYFLTDNAYSHPVNKPIITRLNQEKMPAILDGNGDVKSRLSEVKISAFNHQPHIEGFFSAGERYDQNFINNTQAHHPPVRIQFSRRSSRSSRVFRSIGDPVIFTNPTALITLPELLAYWPLSDGWTNLKDATALRAIGKPILIKDEAGAYVVRFNGRDKLLAANQHVLTGLGSSFSLQITFRISHSCPEEAVLIETNQSQGLSWRLEKNDDLYKSVVYLNGTRITDDRGIPTNTKVTVTLLVDNGKATFFLGDENQNLPAEPIEVSAFFIKHSNHDLTIGAANTSSVTRRLNAFKGEVSNVSIWQKAIHPLEIKEQLAKQSPFLHQQTLTSSLIYRDTKNYQLKTGHKKITFAKTSALKALSTEFSIFMWVKPDNNNPDICTLLGNDRENYFWLGLRKRNNEYHFNISIAGDEAISDRQLDRNQWNHLGISFKSGQISIFINGFTDNASVLDVDFLPSSHLPIAIGSENTFSFTSRNISFLGLRTSEEEKKYPFNGFINDIQFWRESLNIEEWKRKLGAVQTIDRFVENDKYLYRAQAIDLFGRISAFSKPKGLKTKAKPSYNPPVNVHAQFHPIRGRIIEVSNWEEEVEALGKLTTVKKGYYITTDIGFTAQIASKVNRYDLKVKRFTTVPKYIDSDNDGRREVVQVEDWLEQAYEIEEASPISSSPERSRALQFQVQLAAFEQLNPRVDDFLEIDLDNNFTLSFAWTGIQQVYNNSVKNFNMYLHEGLQNEILEPISLLNNLPTDADQNNIFRIQINTDKALNANAFEDFGSDVYCLIGVHKFKLLSNTAGRRPVFRIQYNSSPLVKPQNGDLLSITVPEGHPLHTNYDDVAIWSEGKAASIPINPTDVEPLLLTTQPSLSRDVRYSIEQLNEEDRNDLVNQGVDWLPGSMYYKITLAHEIALNAYQEVKPQDYIPGAIVFFDRAEEQNKWRSFYAVWHHRAENGGIAIYTLPGEKNEPIPSLLISNEYPLKLYTGKKLEYRDKLPDLPTFQQGKPTIQYHLALSSEDDQGNESKLSSQANMVAVNRQNPLPAQKPEAEMLTQADYYGKAEVAISWDLPLGSDSDEWFYYKLFRATDADIYTRDLEQRRARMGFYKRFDDTNLLGIFSDDSDFIDWLQTRRGEITLDELFPNELTEPDQWYRVTPIWRQWAERFYPSLTNDEVKALGERQGNEVAFKLLTGKPIREVHYLDKINGLVSNRYYYRIKTLSQGLAESKKWGPLSDPVKPIFTKPPRKPVFTKIEAGDRQVTLEWSLNREPDFKEYVLYRSENKEDLDDLRWWSNEPDPRIVATIPDPRILSKDNQIELPGDIEIDEVLGVYRVDEFNKEADPIDHQSNAFNYFDTDREDSLIVSPSQDETHIMNLKKIANGVPLIIIYRNSSSTIDMLFQKESRLPFTDSRIEGNKDYYYGLISRNKNQLLSRTSRILHTRTLEINRPKFPKVSIKRSQLSTGSDLVVFYLDKVIEPLLIKVQKYDQFEKNWVDEIPWGELLPGNVTTIKAGKVNSREVMSYRVKVKTNSGLLSMGWHYIDSMPRSIY